MASQDNRFAFTKTKIEAIEPPASRMWYYDTRVSGLALLVTKTGRSFYLARRVSGTWAKMKLGSFPEMTCEQARTRCLELIGVMATGIDPAAARRQSKQELTLSELFNHWLEFHGKPHKKTWQDDQRQFNKYLVSLHNRKLSTITKADIVALHAKLGSDHGHYMANRVLSLVRSIFNKADDVGFQGVNPASKVKAFKEQSRDRFLQPDELPRFFAAVNAEPNETLRDAFLLLLFTGARRSNVQSMRWNDLDLDRSTWRIPETKAGRTQHVSLASPAVMILRRRKESANGSEYVLPGHGKQGHLVEVKTAWARIIKAAGLEDVRVHDLRRTLGSYMAIEGASLNIVGTALGHSQAQTTKVYARLTDTAVASGVTKAVAFIESAAMAAPAKSDQTTE